MKQDKKKWVKPTIEEVALEAEEDVLNTCFTMSQFTKSSAGGCRIAMCATYP